MLQYLRGYIRGWFAKAVLLVIVNTHDDMLKATIKAVSKDATKLGIKVGMTGAEAMELLR